MRKSPPNKPQLPKIKAVKEGFLEKQGQKVKSWKKRWFRLTLDNNLSYHDKKGGKLLKTIPLTSITSIKTSPDAGLNVSLALSKRRKHPLIIQTPTRTWYFLCDSIKERDEWIGWIEMLLLKLKQTNSTKNVHKAGNYSAPPKQLHAQLSEFMDPSSNHRKLGGRRRERGGERAHPPNILFFRREYGPHKTKTPHTAHTQYRVV